MRVSGATRAGRGHRARDVPCQDAFAVWVSPGGGRVAAAVADGLGSRPLSQHGSRAACDAAVASLAADAAAGDGAGAGWDEAALARAFEAARAAVQAEADGRGLPIGDLATTLQVATLDRASGQVHAGMVGDGAVVAVLAPSADGAGAEPDARVLLAPADGGYANEVTPATDPRWREGLQVASIAGARSVLLFTDGLTRLLLARSRPGWQPFPPFFQAFLPRLEGAAFDDRLAATVLAGDAVDRSWDDDKCLVAVSLGPKDAGLPEMPAPAAAPAPASEATHA